MEPLSDRKGRNTTYSNFKSQSNMNLSTMTYYEKPILTETTELDCEPHQAIRTLYRFNVADDCCVDIIAKISKEDNTYVPHTYISWTDDMDTPDAIIDTCLNTAKTKIIEQFESNKTYQRKDDHYA